MAKAVAAKRQDNEARKAEFERVMHYATEWAWADGVEQEAMAALFVVLNFGFRTLGLHRIQAACGPENRPSQRLLAKLGFTPEGRIRDHVFTQWRMARLPSLRDPRQ
jgi:RimJ/RimL family protein N-acetyltransferase